MSELTFYTDRARVRAPVAMTFAAAAGDALLVSARGEIVLAAGELGESDRARIVRRALRCDRTFRDGAACVYVIAVARGWRLVGVSLLPIAPGIAIDRLERAARVLAFALADRPRVDGGPTGGAPAEARSIPRRVVATT